MELASLSDPQYVVPTMASVFNLHEQPNRLLLQALLDFLRKKQLLLLLDTCEHLILDCARLADEILKHALEVRILASSR